MTRLKQTPTVHTCVVVKRTGSDIQMQPGRDHWWHELMLTVDAELPG
jgi:acetyl-CoA synthetase